MPELTGPELYARCFAQSPDLARRFVFASADPTFARRLVDQVVARVGAKQAPPLLTKPTSRAALMAAVAAVIASAPHQSGTYELRLPSGARAERSTARDARREPGTNASADRKQSSRY